MKLGIIMDPIGKINIEKDSSFAMLLAAQKCGWDLLYMELSDLYMDNDTPIARMRNLEVNNDSKKWYSLSDYTVENLCTLDIILMRKCLSTACQKRKSRMHGRGVWASNDYWMTTPIIVLATLFLIVTCVLSFYRSRLVKYTCVRIILWLRRKSRSRTHSM